MVGRKIPSNYNIIYKKIFNSPDINKYHNPNYFNYYKENKYSKKIIEYNNNLEDKIESLFKETNYIIDDMYKKTDEIIKDTGPIINYSLTLEEMLAEYWKKKDNDEGKKDEK
ncbi:hypothetical protein J4471_04175 [Candidatus Woesearchaeota archaeon]|nr:hypothetical protein [Candidatus Woesearchaeota archaeon]